MQILSISSYRIDHRNVKLLFIQENVAIFSAPIVFALSVHAFAKNVNHFYVRNTLHAIVGQSFFPCFKYQLIDWWLGCYLSEVLTGLWIGQQQVRNLVPARSIFFYIIYSISLVSLRIDNIFIKESDDLTKIVKI